MKLGQPYLSVDVLLKSLHNGLFTEQSDGFLTQPDGSFVLLQDLVGKFCTSNAFPHSGICTGHL